MLGAVAGSSVGMLHLLEVPQHVREHAQKELQIMEEYMHRHTQVAENMADLMVRLTPPSDVCRFSPQHQCRLQISLCPFHCRQRLLRKEARHHTHQGPPQPQQHLRARCAIFSERAHGPTLICEHHAFVLICAEDRLSHCRKMNASLRWSIKSWKLSTELNLA